MHILQLSVFVVVANCLTSCGIFGPSYTKPQVEVPGKWANSNHDLTNLDTSINLPDTLWWKSFDDPVLDGLISYALANNPNIQQAIGNIIQAKGQLQQVELSWVPSVGLTAGYSSVGAFGDTTQSSSASAATIGGNTGYSVGLLPSYSLNILQQIRQQQSAKANLAAKQYAKDAIRLSILSQVAGSYFSLLAADLQLKLQQQLVEDTEQQFRIGESQHKAGYISLLALQTYEQTYEDAKSQIPVIEQNIVKIENALRVLMNKNPGTIARGSDFSNIKMEGIIPGNLPSQILRNRPDIKQAESELIASNAEIGVAISKFFPTITLTTPIGSAANQIKNLFSPSNDFWSASLKANLSLLNLSNVGGVRSSKGAYYTAYYNYINVVRGAFAATDTGFATYDQSLKSYKLQNRSFIAFQKAYDIDYIRYKKGSESLIGTLTYKINQDKAAISLVQSKLNVLQSIVDLYQALGGGYNVNNTELPIQFGDSHDS